MREIKLNFTRFYNRRHVRRGYFWGDRFKSAVVEDGNTEAGKSYGVELSRDSIVSALLKKVHAGQGVVRKAPNTFATQKEKS
ncbi:MAG: hypothetical protein V2I40_02525 [Desulfobacteraceae bacterium]|jgi:hypothetical protein|nr:hypothetical protein [Desulfobacteraceae bacterium]